jgi:hypothetical protein
VPNYRAYQSTQPINAHNMNADNYGRVVRLVDLGDVWANSQSEVVCTEEKIIGMACRLRRKNMIIYNASGV